MAEGQDDGLGDGRIESVGVSAISNFVGVGIGTDIFRVIADVTKVLSDAGMEAGAVINVSGTSPTVSSCYSSS